MKTSTIILILLCTITLFSCSQNENSDNLAPSYDYEYDADNISVHYEAEYDSQIRDSLRIYIPITYTPILYIKGGDRNYTITPPDTNLIKITLEQGNILVIEPLEAGTVEIPIMDGANHKYLLKIVMLYTTNSLTVTRTEIVIKGDGLTELEKDTIREKALKTIPVKVDGGYKFTYTRIRGGVVTVYPNSYGVSDDSTQDYSFEYVFRTAELREHYIININDSERLFWYGQGELPTKTNYLLMVEDLTKVFKTEYPAVEKVFAQQQCLLYQDYYDQ